jgi:hypothetical protein
VLRAQPCRFLLSTLALLALTLSRPAIAGESLPVVLHRTPPRWKTGADATHDEERPTSVRLLLLDGRTIADAMPLSTGFQAGIDPNSVEARRLGTQEDDPILVTWKDYSQGQGNYQEEFYVVLSGGDTAAPLLRGALDISGHAGFENRIHATLSIELKGEVLIRRIEMEESHSGIQLAPGCAPRTEEPRVIVCESSTRIESRYRLRSETLEAIGFEESMRLEPGIDLAPLSKQGWRSVRSGKPPQTGDWLRRTLPLKEGAAKYPAVGPLEVQQ